MYAAVVVVISPSFSPFYTVTVLFIPGTFTLAALHKIAVVISPSGSWILSFVSLVLKATKTLDSHFFTLLFQKKVQHFKNTHKFRQPKWGNKQHGNMPAFSPRGERLTGPAQTALLLWLTRKLSCIFARHAYFILRNFLLVIIVIKHYIVIGSSHHSTKYI